MAAQHNIPKGSIQMHSPSFVALVTQTRVAPEQHEEFTRWQQHVNDVIALFPGYLDHTVIPPAPPVQADWVIVQHFSGVEAARAWLQSEQRQHLLEAIQPLLVGQDDIHLFTEGDSHIPSSSVSAVISTRVKAGQEQAFLSWQRRVAATQASFEGFEGCKLEPPIPGIQDNWVTILQFHTDSHLEAWLNSDQRRQLLDEAAAFTAETHTRKARTGFDSWFTLGGQDSQTLPPPWKQSMLVLLVLYPVVFLFSVWVQTPLLMHNGVPFWLALFIGNIVSTVLLAWLLVPQVSKLFKWWLSPSQPAPRWVEWAGAAVVVGLYGVLLLVFALFP
jgi:antibiotic biosynthesis monooxygenase (ABM) superfamily enzyme